jgi:Ser/Thr protein kinase RdoA (MazF antagonist)
VAGEYTSEVVAELEHMVARGLPCWQLSAATAIKLLNVSENATFALSDPSSMRELVLRVHRVGYCTADEIRSELAWINALRAEAIIETAAPIAASDGELVQTFESPSGQPSRFAVAFERLSGREPDAGVGTVQGVERLGALSARMHAHARSWRLPPGFRRRRWDLDAMVGPHGFWGPWRAAIGLDASGVAMLEQTLGFIADRIARFGMGPERFGLIHADLRLANLLVSESHLRIIDFDDCGFSWFLYDFASAVSFIEHEPIVPDLLHAWITGYQRVTPLSGEEVAEIPTFIVLRRILLMAWLASHAEIPFARQFGVAYTAGTLVLAEQLRRRRLLNQVS